MDKQDWINFMNISRYKLQVYNNTKINNNNKNFKNNEILVNFNYYIYVRCM